MQLGGNPNALINNTDLTPVVYSNATTNTLLHSQPQLQHGPPTHIRNVRWNITDNVGTYQAPPRVSDEEYLNNYVGRISRPTSVLNPITTSRPSDSLYKPFMSEEPYDIAKHPLIKVGYGSIGLPFDNKAYYQNHPDFYTDVYKRLKSIQWNSQQLNNSVNLIIDDNKLTKLNKNLLITRIVCTYYLGRRGFDTKMIEDPVVEASRDAGSLANVLGRSLPPETVEKFKSITLTEEDVIGNTPQERSVLTDIMLILVTSIGAVTTQRVWNYLNQPNRT